MKYKHKETGKIVEITQSVNLDGIEENLVSEEIELPGGRKMTVFGYTNRPETFNEYYEKLNETK